MMIKCGFIIFFRSICQEWFENTPYLFFDCIVIIIFCIFIYANYKQLKGVNVIQSLLEEGRNNSFLNDTNPAESFD
jgi:hypothetical protein